MQFYPVPESYEGGLTLVWTQGLNRSTVSQACKATKGFSIQCSTVGLPKAVECQCVCSLERQRTMAAFPRRVGHYVPVVGFILLLSASSSLLLPQYDPGCC